MENFFFSSGNAILSILLKYQEIDVHIQTFFLTKIETSYIVALFDGTNRLFVDYKYRKCGHIFILGQP